MSLETGEPSGLPDDPSILTSIYSPPPVPTRGRGGDTNLPVDAKAEEDEEEDTLEDGELTAKDLDLLEAKKQAKADDGGEDEEEIDPDDVEYEVKVDGAAVKAKLRDLKNAFSGHKAVEARLEQTNELRRKVEATGGALYDSLEAQKNKLVMIDNALKGVSQPDIDWAQLLQADPQRYLIEKEKAREAEGRRAVVAREHERIEREQGELRQQAHIMFAQEQARLLLDELPELRDPEKASAFVKDIQAHGKAYKFSDAELAGIVDKRHIMVMNDAIKYRKLVAAKTEALKTKKLPQKEIKEDVKPKALLRPGAAGFTQRMNHAKAEKAFADRAAETGTVDDVANMLIVRKRTSG